MTQTQNKQLIKEKYIESCHDISLGGILIAITKMCLKGNKGIKINKPKYLINIFEYLFSEDQGRYLIDVSENNLKKVTELLIENSISESFSCNTLSCWLKNSLISLSIMFSFTFTWLA